jgi:hypothetical protein
MFMSVVQRMTLFPYIVCDAGFAPAQMKIKTRHHLSRFKSCGTIAGRGLAKVAFDLRNRSEIHERKWQRLAKFIAHFNQLSPQRYG